VIYSNNPALIREDFFMSAEIIGSEKISGQDAAGMMVRMENDGYLTMKPEDRTELVRLGRQRELGLEEVRDFMKEKLTDDGERAFEEAVETAENPRDLLAILRIVSKGPEEDGEVEIGEIVEEPRRVEIGERRSDAEINRALTARPSSLIANQIDEQLKQAIGETGRAPFWTWVLNPVAGVKVLGAAAREANAAAGVQVRISKTTARLAELAGEDAELDASKSQIAQLEKRYGNQVEQFCSENNLSVPPEGTPDRKKILWQMRILDVASSEQFKSIEKAGRALIRKEVKIKAGTAENRMVARELPAKTEAAKEANAAREAEIAERVRTAMARVAAALSGGAVGTVVGLGVGIVGSVETMIEKYPAIVAVPVVVGVLTLGGQFFVHSGQLSREIVTSFAFKSVVTFSTSAILAGIGAGLAAKFKRGEKGYDGRSSGNKEEHFFSRRLPGRISAGR
jgi:hypothetical protein